MSDNTYCWEDGAYHHRPGHTCLLPEGHTGNHQWSRDDDTYLSFTDSHHG